VRVRDERRIGEERENVGRSCRDRDREIERRR